MPFLPALRSQVKTLTEVETKSAVPVAFAQYYAALATYNVHRRASDWPVERAVVEGYERAIWVFKSVQSIAADSARLPYRLRDGDEELDDHPMYHVLNVQANPLETGQVFRKRLSGQVLLSKRGAFVETTMSNGGYVKRLDLLPPDRTEIIPGRGADLVDHVRLTRRDGSYKNIDWDKVLWFRDPHLLDPYSGVTPVEPAGLSVELDYFARMYNVAFMQNDGRPGGVLAVRDTKGGTSDIDPLQMDRIEGKFSKGPHEAGKLSVIAGDLSYVDLAARPRDMQYGATSKNAKIEVLSAFGVAESVLGYAAERTFDNADAELYGYWTRTMLNHNSILLDGFNSKSADGLEGFFDTSEVEILERVPRQRRTEAREEVAAGLRSIWSYFELADRTEEIDDTPHTRALYVAQGKTPLPSREADMEALGLGAPPGQDTGAGAPPGPGEEPPPGGEPPAPGDAPPGEEPPAAEPTPPTTGANPAPSGPARAALEALAAGKARHPVRVAYRIERKDPLDFEYDESEPDLAAAEDLERALQATLAACADRWVERAAVRVGSPKQRKGTRHFAPEYEHDTRVGTKALDASKAVDEQTWQSEAQSAVHPIIEAAAIAAAVALLTDLDARPSPGVSVVEWARRAVQRTVMEVVDFVGRSAVTQASALIRSINIADQQGDTLPEILDLVRDRSSRMTDWAKGLATQTSTATTNGARDAAAVEHPDPIDRVWFSQRDRRVRFTHMPGTGADGQVRSLHEPFVVGTALLMRPGDVNGPLRETAGCRCFLRHRRRRSGRWSAPPTPGVDIGRPGSQPEVKRAPRDGDGDGFIYDGTVRQRPAQPVHKPVDRLRAARRQVDNDQYHRQGYEATHERMKDEPLDAIEQAARDLDTAIRAADTGTPHHMLLTGGRAALTELHADRVRDRDAKPVYAARMEPDTASQPATVAYGIHEMDISDVSTTRAVALMLHGEGMMNFFPLAWLTWDPKTRTVEGVYVNEDYRGKGIGAELLKAAEKVQGAPLGDSGEYTTEGFAWAKKRGLNPKMRKRTSKSDMARMVANMNQVLWGSEDRSIREIDTDDDAPLPPAPDPAVAAPSVDADGVHHQQGTPLNYRGKFPGKGERLYLTEDGYEGRTGGNFEGAEPGTTSYLDYSVTDDKVYIWFVTTQRDRERQGNAARLVSRLYADHPDKTIEWGEIMDDGSEVLYKRFLASHPDQTGRGWTNMWRTGAPERPKMTGPNAAVTDFRRPVARRTPKPETFGQPVPPGGIPVDVHTWNDPPKPRPSQRRAGLKPLRVAEASPETQGLAYWSQIWDDPDAYWLRLARTHIERQTEQELRDVRGLAEILGNINGSGPEDMPATADPEFTLAVTHGMDITYNHLAFTHTAARLNTEGEKKAGWFTLTHKTIEDAARYVAVHEMGHVISNSISEEHMNQMVRDAVATTPTLTIGRTEEGITLDTKVLKQVLSAYGATSVYEFVAEAWAEYRLARTPRPIAATIGHAMEQYIGEDLGDLGVAAAVSPIYYGDPDDVPDEPVTWDLTRIKGDCQR